MPKLSVIEVTCVICGKRHSVTVPTAGYRLWASGQARIQDALPGVSEDDREMLMSHICPDCWDKFITEE